MREKNEMRARSRQERRDRDERERSRRDRHKSEREEIETRVTQHKMRSNETERDWKLEIRVDMKQWKFRLTSRTRIPPEHQVRFRSTC